MTVQRHLKEVESCVRVMLGQLQLLAQERYVALSLLDCYLARLCAGANLEFAISIICGTARGLGGNKLSNGGCAMAHFFELHLGNNERILQHRAAVHAD